MTESGLPYAVHLSSYGAHVPEGTGPVTGLHWSEQKLNAIGGLNVLHLRAAYFMENNLAAISMIQEMGPSDTHCFRPEAAHDDDRDVGNYAAPRLLDLDFSANKLANCLAKRDLSMAEATAIIARAIGNETCVTCSFLTTRCSSVRLGMPPKKAACTSRCSR